MTATGKHGRQPTSNRSDVDRFVMALARAFTVLLAAGFIVPVLARVT